MLKKLIFRVILTILFGVIGTGAHGQASSGLDHVYIISSYDYQNEWGQMLAKKLKKEIDGTLKSNNTEIFFTGLNKVDSLQTAREILNPAQWSEKAPSLLIVIGYEAWMTLRSFNDTLLKKTPIILCGVQNKEFADYELFLKNKRNALSDNFVPTDSLLSGYNALAITIKDNTEKTLKEITGLLPQTREIIFISEQSYTDNRYAQRFEEAAVAYPSLRFSVQKVANVNELALASLKNKINEENTVLILNNYNAPENPNRQQSLVMPEVPIFLLQDKELAGTSGLVGGTFEPIPIYANRIISGIKDILAEKKERGTPDESVLVNVIKQSAAQKYNIDTKGLSDLMVLTEPQSGQNDYLLTIIGFILLPLLFVGTLVLLIGTFLKQKHTTQHINKYASSVTKFQTIYRNIPVGIGAFNEDGTHREWNQEFLKVLRLILPDFKPSNRFNLFTSGIITDDIQDAIRQGKVSEKIMTVEQNETQTSARLIFTPMATRTGNGIIVSIFDVTQTLDEKEKRNLINQAFDKAIGESRMGIAELDFIKGRCIATDGWYKGLNVMKNTPLDLCFANLHPDDKIKFISFLETLSQHLAGEILTLELRIQQLDTTYNWTKFTFYIKDRNDESGKVICSVVLEDVHARKQTEEQLKETYTRILSGNKMKNSFLSNMSNDIRMPLNAIVGFSELIIESTDSEEQKELVKYLNENNEKFLKLVSDIVDMSQIAAGTLKCRMSDVDINEMMNELLATARTQLTNPHVQLTFQNSEKSCIVYSDREKLHQVMTNFISNAIKATEAGSIELGYRLLSKKIQLYVKDTGCGVEPEKQEHLFDRFSKANKEYTGAGTGLSVSAAIVKLLKGEIGFDSEADKGSTFWCSIPSEYVGTDTQIGLTGKLESATKLMGGNMKTILIAEDNANNFQLLNFILKGKFKVVHAINGEKAVEMFKQHNPDIILMDIKMPVMDGYEATAAIREISKEVPIIAVTAYAFNNDKEKILDSSFTGFIAKPVREKELMETINDILNK